MTPKPPIDPVRWQPPPIDPIPDLPPAELTIVPLPGDAPEDVVVDADGHLWTGLVDGRILRLAPTATPASSRPPRAGHWACTSPTTAGSWCAPAPAGCSPWTRTAVRWRRSSARSTTGR